MGVFIKQVSSAQELKFLSISPSLPHLLCCVLWVTAKVPQSGYLLGTIDLLVLRPCGDQNLILDK